MKVTHTFMVHGICPFVEHVQFDYYDCIIETTEVIDVHEIEKKINEFRGMVASQEDLCCKISQTLVGCEVTLRGRHNQNSNTSVTCKTYKVSQVFQQDYEVTTREQDYVGRMGW